MLCFLHLARGVEEPREDRQREIDLLRRFRDNDFMNTDSNSQPFLVRVQPFQRAQTDERAQRAHLDRILEAGLVPWEKTRLFLSSFPMFVPSLSC